VRLFRYLRRNLGIVDLEKAAEEAIRRNLTYKSTKINQEGFLKSRKNPKMN